MNENISRTKRYSKQKIQLIIIHLFLTVVFLLIMIFSGISLFLKNTTISWSHNFYLQVGLYLSIFAGIYYSLFLPLDFYEDFILEHKFSLSNQTVISWLKKMAKKALLSFLMLLLTVEALYFSLRLSPNHWWLLATLGWILLAVVLTKIAPALIIPLFYKCTPLADVDVKERLLTLGRLCGVKISDVLEIKLSKDTKKANAAVAGFGKGRRILLGDTLLGNYSNDEIEAVFAHELGHIRMFHILKILGFGAIISLVCFFIAHLLLTKAISLFGFGYIYDIAAFPLLLLVLMITGLALMPIQNAYMRYLEKQADLFALDQIQNNESFVSAMKKLTEQNLIDPAPSKLVELLMYTHPPISKRVAYASEKNYKNSLKS